MKPDKVALFQTSGANLALMAARIEAVVEASRLYCLPQLPADFAGVSVDRGRIIPILAGGLLPGGGQGLNKYQVLCRSEYGLVGISVCSIGLIVEGHEGVEERPGDPGQSGSIGFFLHREERYPLLDVDLLLGSLNEVRLQCLC
jgi:chemotaxis signal transduction protein